MNPCIVFRTQKWTCGRLWQISRFHPKLCFYTKKPVKVSQGSTYSELLSVIEEMSREIRPTYAGSKSAMERLKRGKCNLFSAATLYWTLNARENGLLTSNSSISVWHYIRFCSWPFLVNLNGLKEWMNAAFVSLHLICYSGIIHARALVRECLAETERSART